MPNKYTILLGASGSTIPNISSTVLHEEPKQPQPRYIIISMTHELRSECWSENDWDKNQVRTTILHRSAIEVISFNLPTSSQKYQQKYQSH